MWVVVTRCFGRTIPICDAVQDQDTKLKSSKKWIGIAFQPPHVDMSFVIYLRLCAHHSVPCTMYAVSVKVRRLFG
jgi:hypothetical protein